MNESNIEFYINKICIVKSEKEADITFIPPMVRRRLSAVDKVTLFVLNNTYSENVQNLIFVSRKGEVERLVKIINQYTTDGEVSPNTFSGSVHNYPAGFFLLNKKKSIPYTALSACESSISAGFLSALLSDYHNVLLCYADPIGVDYCAFGVNLSKKQGEKKYRIVLNNSKEQDNFTEFTDLLNEKIDSLEMNLYRIEKA